MYLKIKNIFSFSIFFFCCFVKDANLDSSDSNMNESYIKGKLLGQK